MGRIRLTFTDGTNADGAADGNGQPLAADGNGQPLAADSDQSETTYQLRTIDLSAYADKTVGSTAIVEGPQTPTGDMYMFFGEVAITSADGTVATIYNNGQTSLGYSGTSGVAVEGTESGLLGYPGDPEMAQEATNYLLGDQLGSTRVELSAAGWPVSSSSYYPYGQGPQPASNHYLFTGKERDSESGNDYFGARYYASSMGRFMSPDYQDPDDDDTPEAIPNGAITDPQTLNLYSFTQNNPLKKRDYDGHASWQPCPDESGAQCWTGDYNGEYNNGLFWNSQTGQWQQNDPTPPPDGTWGFAGTFIGGFYRTTLAQSGSDFIYGLQQMACGGIGGRGAQCSKPAG